MDSTLVVYTGLPFIVIPASPGDNLQTILGAIDTAINTSSAAPDYSGYSLECMRDTYTINTTQQFAEAIANLYCTLQADYDAFTGTTYPAQQSIITNAITNIQTPALTYAPTVDGTIAFNITNTDSLAVVYTKLFSGLDAMIAESDPSGADWASISVTPPTNVKDAADVFISIFASLEPALAPLTDLLPLNGPYDNSANCLTTGGGTSTDNADATIRLLTTLLCAQPTFDPTSMIWGCLTPGSDLQSTIQSIVTFGSAYADAVVSNPGAGMAYTAGSSCSGATMGMDPSYESYYKVISETGDGSPDFLRAKVVSGDGSLAITIDGNKRVDFRIATPLTSDHKVMVDSLDPSPGYLQDKIPSTGGNWGLSIVSDPSPDNTQLILTPTVSNPDQLANNLLDYILSDPDLLAKFCALKDACIGCACDAPTGLTVTLYVGS